MEQIFPWGKTVLPDCAAKEAGARKLGGCLNVFSPRLPTKVEPALTVREGIL
jgi:hypothetical protein